MHDNKTTVYLADDHQIVIDGLSLLLSNEKHLVVVGTATSGEKASKDIIAKKPDIAIIDFSMPGISGLDVIASLRKSVSTKFIILSMHSERHHIAEAISYGAMGYIIKNTGRNELLACVEKVINGIQAFPIIAAQKGQSKSIFTPREFEILRLVVADLTTQVIADMLHLSHYTVETHRKNICRKADAKTIVGLLKFIKENKISL